MQIKQNMTQENEYKPNNNKTELTQELVKSLLNYNPDTGVFTWREMDVKWFKTQDACNKWNLKNRNKNPQKTRSVDGYSCICIFRKRYSYKKIIHLYINGNIKEYEITGVQVSGDKFRARIFKDKKLIHIGVYDTKEEAHQAYCDAKRQISPEFNML
jgi:hypothetical protein